VHGLHGRIAFLLSIFEGLLNTVHTLTVEELVVAIAPEPPLTAPAHLRAIAEAYPHAAHLSLDEFAEVLYEQNIYRAIDKGGHERPVNRGTLKKI